MTNALIFRALERNTGKVGLASALCTQTAVNVEIQAISQHQVTVAPYVFSVPRPDPTLGPCI